MVRQQLMKKGVGSSKHFRWRGGDVSRLEGFSDAVFGFALTLLVVSLEVPKSFDDLMNSMRGFAAFAICFTLLFMVWYQHYVFFRHYGLQDTLTIVLNAFLLFVVMFYVYPLKFLFTMLIGQFMGDRQLMIKGEQVPQLMIIYGLGFVAVYLIFALLYTHAYRKRAALELNELEVFDTKSGLLAHLLIASIGLLSIVIAAIGGQKYAALSGMIYFLTCVVMTIHGFVSGARRRKIEDRFDADAAAARGADE